MVDGIEASVRAIDWQEEGKQMRPAEQPCESDRPSATGVSEAAARQAIDIGDELNLVPHRLYSFIAVGQCHVNTDLSTGNRLSRDCYYQRSIGESQFLFPRAAGSRPIKVRKIGAEVSISRDRSCAVIAMRHAGTGWCSSISGRQSAGISLKYVDPCQSQPLFPAHSHPDFRDHS
jgi:hypothetical protein